MNRYWVLVLFAMFLLGLLLNALHLYVPKARPALFVLYPFPGVCAGLWYGRQQGFPPGLTVVLAIAIGVVGLQAYRVIYRHVP